MLHTSDQSHLTILGQDLTKRDILHSLTNELQRANNCDSWTLALFCLGLDNKMVQEVCCVCETTFYGFWGTAQVTYYQERTWYFSILLKDNVFCSLSNCKMPFTSMDQNLQLIIFCMTDRFLTTTTCVCASVDTRGRGSQRPWHTVQSLHAVMRALWKNCTLCQLSEVVACNAAGVEFDPISATNARNISADDTRTETIACRISCNGSGCVKANTLGFVGG